MEFKVKELPLLLLTFLSTISPYFLGLYLFNRSEFIQLGYINIILLSIAYSAPVLYMNLNHYRIRYNHNPEKYKSDNHNNMMLAIAISSIAIVYTSLIICDITNMFFIPINFILFKYISWIYTLIHLIICWARFGRTKK